YISKKKPLINQLLLFSSFLIVNSLLMQIIILIFITYEDKTTEAILHNEKLTIASQYALM
ncbi:hypothetical protein, partial [Citrobacter freundii]|uniref:hypothetical protein n=1 Tax=Citrobacter freundii TaxID=546 RepID=UPI001A92CCC4